jgi:hypothetical protein
MQMKSVKVEGLDGRFLRNIMVPSTSNIGVVAKQFCINYHAGLTSDFLKAKVVNLCLHEYSPMFKLKMGGEE